MRKAFTLTELLVVMFVAAVLVGLLMPVIQRTREAARQTYCTSNQKQLAYAFQLYENRRNSLPGWRDYVPVVVPSRETSGDNATDRFFSNALPGSYSPGDEVAAQASWVFIILPELEQTELYERLKNGRVPIPNANAISTEIPPIPILLCRSHTTGFKYRATNYVVNGGAVDYFTNELSVEYSVDDNIANGPFLDRAALREQTDRRKSHTVVSLSDISKRDGTAHTLFTSENLQRGFWIARDLVHFYNDRAGGDRETEVLIGTRLETRIGSDDWSSLPDDRSARPRPVVSTRSSFVDTDQGFTIEGSVAFCWPRVAINGGTAYPPQPQRSANPYRGFSGSPNSSIVEGDLKAYRPANLFVDDPDKVPVFPNLFRDHLFPDSWYTSARPSSHHPGALVVSFADGNARRISDEIDEHVFVNLMTVGSTQSDAGRRVPGGNLLENYLFDARVLD